MHQSGADAMTPPTGDLAQAKSEATNVGAVERWLSLAAAAFLLISGARKRSAPFLLGGGALLYRAATGFCPVYHALQSGWRGAGVEIEKTITVYRPVEEIYRLWRNVENLPRFMSHLESVTAVDEIQSHWVARIPGSLRLEWDAVIAEERENESISWCSLPASDVEHAGAVYFRPVPGKNATEVRVVLSYRPPGGVAGTAVAKLLSAVTEH
ncbi:MAG: SRPBCC family protein, partial [Candidatus Binatia bacterium]